MGWHFLAPQAVLVTASIDTGDETPLRQFFWARWIAATSLVVLLTLTIAWLTWNWRASRRLSAERAAWGRAGLPTKIEDFAQPPVPNELNAATLILEAAAADAKLRYDPADYVRNPDALIWPQPLRRQAENALAANQKMLELAAGIPARKRVAWPATSPSTDAEFFAADRIQWGIHSIRRYLELDAQVAAQAGDALRFLQDVLVLDALRRDLMARPDYASYLLAFAADAQCSLLVRQFAFRMHVEGDARAAAQALITRLAEPDEQQAAQRLYRIKAFDTYRWLEHSLDDLGVMASPNGIDESRGSRITRWLLGPLRKQDAANLLAQIRLCAAAFEANEYRAAENIVAAAPDPRWSPRFEPADSVVWAARENNGFWPSTEVARLYRSRLTRRAAAAILAARLYAADHDGQPPPSLAAMVPQQMSAVPLDPYAAHRPLGYKFDAAGEPFLYSVGYQGIDRIGTGAFMPVRGKAFLSPYENIFYLRPLPPAGPATLPSYIVQK